MVKFLDQAGLSALWNKIKSAFYTKEEVYNKNELDDIVAHDEAINVSGDLTAEMPTLSDVINNANAHSVKVSSNSVHVNTSTDLVSSRIFPFDQIQDITVYIKELFANGTNGVLNHYQYGTILTIVQNSNTYLRVSISNGYNFVITQYINGTKVHEENLGSINSSSGVYLNAYGDFAVTFNKRDMLFRVFGYNTTDKVIVQRAQFDISSWDLSSLINIHINTSVGDYATVVYCNTVVVNSPLLLSNHIAKNVYLGEYNVPQGTNYIEDLYYAGTGITNDGTIVETISNTNKIISVSKSAEGYFKLGQTNQDSKYAWYHFKLTFTSVGEGAYINVGAGRQSSVFESEGISQGSKFFPQVGKTYNIYIEWNKGTGLGYAVNYALKVYGDLTFEVSDFYMFNRQAQNLCAETYNGQIFTGAIPFSGSNIRFSEYLPATGTYSTVKVPIGAIKVTSGVLAMWNGSAWKNISS